MNKLDNVVPIPIVRIMEWLPIIGPIVTGAIAAAGAIWRDRPKVAHVVDRGFSINYANDLRVEEKEFAINWGIVGYKWVPVWRLIGDNGKLAPPLGRIFLAEIPINSTIELYYYRSETLEEYLPKFSYIIVHSGSNRKRIYLVKRKFYRANSVNKVYIIVKTPLDPSLKANVTHSTTSGFIEVINQNSAEVLYYTIDLPSNVTREYIDESNNLIEDLVERTDTGSPTNETNMRIIIRSIPARKVDQAGRVRIPFKKPIPLS